jgi:N-terminal domain of anti-restriction factor ArdC
MANKTRRLSEQEREGRRRRDRERLEQATAELLTSDGWRRWLRTRSVLHGYSLTNTLLIAQQAHARGIDPTYVAGFKAWLRLGRCVRRGQKGLQIWAPMRIKVRDAESEEGEERKLRFRVTTVFDVSQTEPLRRGPTPPRWRDRHRRLGGQRQPSRSRPRSGGDDRHARPPNRGRDLADR